MTTLLRTLIASLLLTTAIAHAGVERDLRQMVGFTVMYAGIIQEVGERSYGEKIVRLDNGLVFKLDCLMMMPINMTNVVVFGKNYPPDVIARVPNLPAHLQLQVKLLIDREMCDATQVR